MEGRVPQQPGARSVDDIMSYPRDPGNVHRVQLGASMYRSIDDIMNNPREAAPAQVSPTGNTVEPVSGWQSGYKAVHDHMVLSGGSFNQAVQGLQVLVGTKEFAKAQEDVETQDYLKAQQDTADYINGDGYKSAATTLSDSLMSQIPTMGAAGAGAALGAGVAFAVGAPVVVPAIAGGAIVLGTLGAGSMMYDLMRRNVHPGLARAGALGAGIINGAIAGFGGAAFGKVMSSAALNMAQRIAANTGINVSLSSLSAFNDAVTKMAATHIDGGADKYDMGQAMRDLGEAVKTAAITGPLMAGAGELGAAGAKYAASKMLPEEALNHLTNAYNRKRKQMEDARKEKEFQDHVANNEAVQNQARAKFESAINEMSADELGWFMKMADIGPETRAIIEKRWRQIADPDFNGHTSSDGPGTPGVSDKGMKDQGMEPPGGGGKEPPKEPPSGGSGEGNPEEPGGKKPKFKKAKEAAPPPKAPEDKELQELVDKALVAARFRKGAAKKQLDSAKKAQGEGRELTAEEKAALEDETFISMDQEKEREHVANRLKTAIERANPAGRTAGLFNVSLRGKLAIAFQDAPPAVAEELTNALDPGPAIEQGGTLQNNYLELGFGNLEVATGLPRAKIEDLGFAAGRKPIQVQYYGPGRDGKVALQTAHLTLDQMLDGLLKMKNKKALIALTDWKEGNGFTLEGDAQLEAWQTSTEQAFKNALGNADVSYLHMLDGFAAYYETMGETLKKSYEHINPGKEFTLEENYGGQVVREGGVERQLSDSDFTPHMPGDEISYGEAGKMGAGTPGFTYKRGGLTAKIELQGAFRQLRQRARQQAQYEAMAGPAKQWNRVLNNAQILKALEIKFGQKFVKSLIGHYKDVVYGRSQAQGEYNEWVNGVMQARSLDILGLKPMQAVKHLTTIYQFALTKYNGEFIPSKALLDGTIEVATDAEARNRILNWPEVENRYADQDRMAGVINPDTQSPRMKRAQQGYAGTAWFALGDKPALLGGVNAVYKWVLEKTGSEEIAKAEAVKAYRNILASGSMDQQSDFARAPILKIWQQFGQPESRLKQHVLESWRTAANFPTKENLRSAVRTTMISHVAAGLFVLPEAMMALASGNAEDAKKRATTFFQHLTLGNMFPLERVIEERLYAKVMNTFLHADIPEHEASDAVSDTIEKTMSFTQEVLDILSEGAPTMYEVLTLAIDTIQGPLAVAGKGIPVTPLYAARSMFPKPEKEKD